MPYEKEEYEDKLNALARYILNHFKRKEDRQTFLMKLEKRHGTAVVEDIRQRMMKEWAKSRK